MLASISSKNADLNADFVVMSKNTHLTIDWDETHACFSLCSLPKCVCIH